MINRRKKTEKNIPGGPTNDCIMWAGLLLIKDVDEKQDQSEFEFRISDLISKARSEQISGQIRIMVNQVHYS